MAQDTHGISHTASQMPGVSLVQKEAQVNVRQNECLFRRSDVYETSHSNSIRMQQQALPGEEAPALILSAPRIW